MAQPQVRVHFAPDQGHPEMLWWCSARPCRGASTATGTSDDGRAPSATRCCVWRRDGQDFQQLMDLTGLFRVWNPQYKSWSVFGQDHLAKVLLQWDTSAAHNAVG